MTFQPVVNALTKIFTDILNFVPGFVNGLIVLVIGYLVSALVRWIVRLVLRGVRLEQFAQDRGIISALRGLGIHAPIIEIVAQVIFFFLILSFATSAMTLMGMVAVATLLNNVLSFIPRAISASIILIFGSMLARFLGGTVTSVADSVNVTYANALGKIIEYAILAFVIVLAISTLGVDTTILTTSLTIIVAATGLALALTFAFGSRDSARNVIAGYYVRQAFQPGQRLTFGNYTGTVRTTFGTYTVLDVTSETGERSTVSLPNTLLLRSAVLSQETPPAIPNSTNEPQPGNA